jgi:RNA polymerase sigma factor (sigma-70 family)
MTESDLVKKYQSKVELVAKQVVKRCSPETLEDAFQAGLIGLIKAFRRFDPSHGSQFWTYAEHRVRGEIIDQARSTGVFSRTEMKLVNAGELSVASFGEIHPLEKVGKENTSKLLDSIEMRSVLKQLKKKAMEFFLIDWPEIHIGTSVPRGESLSQGFARSSKGRRSAS